MHQLLSRFHLLNFMQNIVECKIMLYTNVYFKSSNTKKFKIFTVTLCFVSPDEGSLMTLQHKRIKEIILFWIFAVVIDENFIRIQELEPDLKESRVFVNAGEMRRSKLTICSAVMLLNGCGEYTAKLSIF